MPLLRIYPRESITIHQRYVIKKNILFQVECSKVSHHLHIVQQYASVLITSYCKKKLLLWELSNSLIYRFVIRGRLVAVFSQQNNCSRDSLGAHDLSCLMLASLTMSVVCSISQSRLSMQKGCFATPTICLPLFHQCIWKGGCCFITGFVSGT